MASVQRRPASAALVSEATLLEQANDLILQGFQLQDMQSLDELECWDEAVNELLQVVNDQVLTYGFSSKSLKPRIECLLELYVGVLTSLAELQRARQSRSLELRQQRQAITG
jgi:hypothetical protein